MAVLPKFWGHPLPGECPPIDAEDAFDGVVLRLVKTDPPTADDFKFGKASGIKTPKDCDECRWCACSVWDGSVKREVLTGVAKFPKLRNNKFIAHIKIDGESGKVMPHAPNQKHYSLWMYDTFDPLQAVVKIEPL
jgi:hypothetical protein